MMLGRIVWGLGKFTVKHVLVPIAITAVTAVVLQKLADRVDPDHAHANGSGSPRPAPKAKALGPPPRRTLVQRLAFRKKLSGHSAGAGRCAPLSWRRPCCCWPAA